MMATGLSAPTASRRASWAARAQRALLALRTWRKHHPRGVFALRTLLATLVVAAAVVFFLAPQFAAASGDIARLGHIPWYVVAGALGLEALSLVSFSVMTRGILADVTVPFYRLLAIDLADLAVNHTLPGGGATATAVRYRLLRGEHVPARRAIGVAAIETAISNLALSLLFSTGAVLLLTRLDGPWYVVAGVLVVVLVGAELLVGWALVARAERTVQWAGKVGRIVPFVREHRAIVLARELSEQLTSLVHSPRRAILCLLAALGNWLLDAVVLWCMVAAFGEVTDPVVVLIAYTVATLVAQLPLSPGGLGMVESVATTALIGLGVGHAAALFGVLAWRVVEYLLPTPVGWVAYIVLRVRRRDLQPDRI